MQDNISRIKDRLGVVEVVSGYLKLQKAGVNFKAPCPFHNEKTPSFFVTPERQIWHCFGCQKGGDIFTFVKEIEGVEFPEALRILAAKAGIELQAFDSEVKDSRDHLYQICESAAKFFEKQLSGSDAGRKAGEYLAGRGLKAETIGQFRLGFAPNTWDALVNYLRSSGYSEKDIVDSGLAIKREAGGIYDRFRSRIMFPIADATGRVVGFTGRVFGQENEKEAKYINTPQTLIYDKSRILYALNHARTEIRRSDSCLMVEGNMDAIMSHQAGVKNVVATSGTALTASHLQMIRRYTNNLNFCFDTDKAGAMATRRGIGMALASNLNVKVVSISDPEAKDPADLVLKSVAEWEKAAAGAKPVLDFYFEKEKQTYDPNSAESKKGVILAVAPLIKRLNSRVERSHWISKLANFLRVREEDVESDLTVAPDDLNIYEVATAQDRTAGPTVKSAVARMETQDVLNEAIVSLAVSRPRLLADQLKAIDPQFLNETSAYILAELTKEDLANLKIGEFIAKFDSDKALDLEFAYLKAQALWEGFNDEELKVEFSNIINKLKLKNIRAQLAGLGQELKSAEVSGDRERIQALAARFTELTNQLATIHKI